MSLLNRPLLGIVALFGISSIIGSGFCMWVFGAEGETSFSTEAKIEVSTLADVGKLRLIGNLEAQQEVKEDYKENNKLGDATEDNWDSLQTNDGVKIDNLIKMYTTRKIVFTEGNEDSNSLKDGLTFYRFKRDKYLDIRTYIRENEVRGGYAFVPSDQYDTIINGGMKFKIGLRVTMPSTDNGRAISDYLELDEKYNPDNSNNPTFSIYHNGSYVNFLDLTDSFFKFEDATPKQEDTSSDDSTSSDTTTSTRTSNEVVFSDYIEDFSNCKVFNFELDLQDMFSYKIGKKPNTSAKLEEIRTAIALNRDLWKVNFDFITTYVD